MQPAPASAGVMRWETVSTPNSQPNKNDVLNPLFSDNKFGGSEIRDLVVGNDGKTLLAAVTVDSWTITPGGAHIPTGIIMSTNNQGISWTQSPYLHLVTSTG
jgi:hypothetical protein